GRYSRRRALHRLGGDDYEKSCDRPGESELSSLANEGSEEKRTFPLSRHARTNYQMYEAKDEPMPVAIMIGHHPMYYFAAATTTQYGVDELEIASALLKEEVELVKCETVDLEVPARTGTVLEGEI